VVDRIVLVGASGFVGSAVAEVLRPRCDLVTVEAPRVRTSARTTRSLLAEVERYADLPALVQAVRGADVVVNAAGDPDASSQDEDGLFGANALLPALLLHVAEVAGVRRFVHVSSAVVQNDKSTLDSSEEMWAFSPYSASKVMGELVLREKRGVAEVVRYRPPSVHAPGRRVTRLVSRIARSRLAVVASPGSQLTPQALLPNVASAVAYLATTPQRTPAVVHHPTEGITVEGLMRELSGGRRPLHLPRWLAVSMVSAAKAVGHLHKPTAANARRLELLMLGQGQAASWLTASGWSPPVGREGWKALAPRES